MALEKVTRINYGLPRNTPRFPVYSYWFNQVVDYLNTYLPSGLGGTITPVSRTNNPVLAANLPNDNISVLDAAIGADNTAVSRTNNPTVVNTTLNAKVQALDNAIGGDNTPIVRTNNPTVANTTVIAKVQALDAAIGVTPTSTTVISAAASVNTNLSAVDAALAALPSLTTLVLKTVKKTVGGVGVAGCDFNFVTAANTTEQPIDLGAIVPAKARVLDIMTFTNSVFTGATTLVATVGNVTGGNQFITSTTIYAASAITAMAVASWPMVVPNAAATHVWINGTPGANWSNVTAGKVTVYVTYIDVTNV
jgi:hypothetical protein